MSLYTRLIGIDQPMIRIHQFMAAIAEFRRGRLTAQQIIAAFHLNSSEQADLLALRNRVQQDQLSAVEIHDVVLLAQSGLFYADEASLKQRLGV